MNAATKVVVRLSIMMCVAGGAALADDFDLSWYTFDGGGGFSAGGDFELEGAVGQPDAGTVMTGGDFTLRGGFWPGGGAGAEPCVGDLDGNGQTDLEDYTIFAGCMEGTRQPLMLGCEAADIDTDGDVDLGDFALFQVAFGCP